MINCWRSKSHFWLINRADEDIAIAVFAKDDELLGHSVLSMVLDKNKSAIVTFNGGGKAHRIASQSVKQNVDRRITRVSAGKCLELYESGVVRVTSLKPSHPKTYHIDNQV